MLAPPPLAYAWMGELRSGEGPRTYSRAVNGLDLIVAGDFHAHILVLCSSDASPTYMSGPAVTRPVWAIRST
jgi:hypothetical protein